MFTPALILVRILYGLASAFYAKKRKLNPYFWFFLGLFLDVLALLAIFFISRKKTKQEPTIVVPPIPAPIPKAESTTLWYYLDPTNAQMGPVSENYLQDLYQKNIISAETYLWSEEMIDWKKYKDIFAPKEPLGTK